MKGSSLLRGGALLLLALGVMEACGSSASKKKIPVDPPAEAGEAGQAGEPNAAAGAPPTGGTAGELAGAAGEAGSGGDAGAGGAGPSFHGLYLSPDGSDTNGGSREEPFLTLAHAVSVAVPGDTIVFLDGTFPAIPSATIPDGVDVMADNSGAAKLACQFQNVFTLAGSSRI